MTTSVYIGYDARETRAYAVCASSLRARASGAVAVEAVSYPLLGARYRRPVERVNGVLWDTISRAPMSTEFSLARFWVPLLQRTDWAVFCDCDFLWRAPVEQLLELRDDRYAVMVVKHNQRPGETVKMDGQPQTTYPRKNWSSLMLLNCDAIIAKLGEGGYTYWLETATGRELHGFRWLRDSEIGELPLEWNWLVGSSLDVARPRAVHFTLGTPDLPGYEAVPYADEWWSYARR